MQCSLWQHIFQNWNDAEKISVAPAQGWQACSPENSASRVYTGRVIAHIYAHASTREHMAGNIYQGTIPIVGQISWCWNETIKVLGSSLIWGTSTPSRKKTVQRNSKKKRVHNSFSFHCWRTLSKNTKQFRIIKRAQVVSRSRIKSQIPPFSEDNSSVPQFPHQHNGNTMAVPYTSECHAAGWGGGESNKIKHANILLTGKDKTNVQQQY